MRIILGTANWGLNYGISNINGVLNNLDLEKVVNRALNNNLNYLDTASAYGDAESKIGGLKKNKIDVITKIRINENRNVKKVLLESLRRLKKENIYGCLIHSFDEFKKDNQIWYHLLECKREGMTKKVGYSLYETKELDYLIEKDIFPDIIQLPYSILDRKFETYFKLLKERGVEIHCRSVYLQGLYFLDPNALKGKLIKLKESLLKLTEICKNHSTSVLEISTLFVLKNKFIDFVVLGVDNEDQLSEIIKISTNRKKLNKAFNEIKKIKLQKKLLNPVNW